MEASPDNSEEAPAKISQAALVAEIGAAAAASALKQMKFHGGQFLIPDHECLRVGDVILTRPSPTWRSRDRKSSLTEEVQRKHGIAPDCASWSHAMLYVGQLHAIESNKPYSMTAGVEIMPLTRDCADHEFMILRYKDPEFEVRRQHIVRYALLHRYINPRQYDWQGAWDAFRARRPRGAIHADAITCSEFILECFAIFGPYLIERYVEITTQKDRFFLPGHLAEDTRFEQLKMRYYDLC